MPELPEVEAVKTMLSKRILNNKILKTEIFNRTSIARPSVEAFNSLIRGLKINKIDRVGKYLILSLEKSFKLVIHLRMTGNLVYAEFPSKAGFKEQIDLPEHTRIEFDLKNKDGNSSKLYFCDRRKFGRLWLFGKDENYLESGIGKLGVEAVSENLSMEYLYNKLSATSRAVKTALLDQTIVSGIGNIYSDEILFQAHVRPDSPCSQLSKSQISALHKAIPTVIKQAITANSIAIEKFISGASNQYSDLDTMFVYQRSGKECKICGQKIEKLTISGRSACFCPNCQL